MFTTRLKSIGIVGGRIGYAAERALFYVSAGYAIGNVSFDVTDANVREDGSLNRNSTGHKYKSRWLSGFALGAGLDYQFTNNWAAGLQYNYVNLGSPKWDMTTSSYWFSGNYAGEAVYIISTRNLNAHMVGVSLKYMFQ
jgi:outer membrane immunogenic protein